MQRGLHGLRYGAKIQKSKNGDKLGKKKRKKKGNRVKCVEFIKKNIHGLLTPVYFCSVTTNTSAGKASFGSVQKAETVCYGDTTCINHITISATEFKSTITTITYQISCYWFKVKQVTASFAVKTLPCSLNLFSSRSTLKTRCALLTIIVYYI